MKNVLIVSYFFPPMPGAGPLRPGRLAKLLPEFGWVPTTLTGPWRDGASELGEIIPLTPFGDPVAPKIRYLERVVSTPARWAPGALRRALALARRRRFDAIVSISNPVFNHLLAATVAHRTGLPWLADYSEAWSGNQFAPKSPVARTLNRKLEQRCMQRASAITCATPGIRSLVAKLHARTDIEVIGNAVDLSEWQHVPNEAPQSFTFLMVGMLWGGRLSPDLLFAAVAKLRQAGQAAGRAARFEYYGDDGRLVAEAARRHGIVDAVDLHPLCARERVMLAERRAAVLVILFPMRPISVVPSKLFEFYGARRPILAVGPDESKAHLGSLIEGNRLGLFVTSEEECAAAIRTLYERHLRGEFETNPHPGWSPPTAETTTRRFATILDRIAPAPAVPALPEVLVRTHA